MNELEFDNRVVISQNKRNRQTVTGELQSALPVLSDKIIDKTGENCTGKSKNNICCKNLSADKGVYGGHGWNGADGSSYDKGHSRPVGHSLVHKARYHRRGYIGVEVGGDADQCAEDDR